MIPLDENSGKERIQWRTDNDKSVQSIPVVGERASRTAFRRLERLQSPKRYARVSGLYLDELTEDGVALVGALNDAALLIDNHRKIILFKVALTIKVNFLLCNQLKTAINCNREVQ